MKCMPSLDIFKWCMAVLIVAALCQLFIDMNKLI